MADVALLAPCPLFSGLDVSELEPVAQRARSRRFASGEVLCHRGERTDRCWVITAGLIDVVAATGAAEAGEVVARRRKGAAVGEVAALLGEPQPETLVASIPTSALELSSGDLEQLARRFPQILLNAVRSAHGRIERASARTGAAPSGETVALAAGASLRRVVPKLIEAARAATPGSVSALDRSFSFAGAVTAAEELVHGHTTVLLPVELDTESIETLLRESDRVVALAGTALEVAQLGAVQRRHGANSEVEVVLVGGEARNASAAWPPGAPLRAVRTLEPAGGLTIGADDLAWLGRHLTGTKLGLALGAGGAKGYAHVGVLGVLEEAGYVVDCVSGSSIGAIVGTLVALGHRASEIEAALRRTFDAENVEELFRISLAGRSSGTDLMRKLVDDMTADRSFADTSIPLTVMAVDLTRRAPAPLRSGSLSEALMAATALAGMRPPHEWEGRRLVDGLALVPVPTGAAIEQGADITVAVNVLGRETLARWPGAPPPEPPPQRRRRNVLDDLLEVMDLSQLEDSARHTELADVPITPRFGPAHWRDFHLADQFLAAGRAAAEAALPALRALALPAHPSHNTQTEGGEVGRADEVRI